MMSGTTPTPPPSLADEVVSWFTDPDTRQDPWDFFDRLRAEEPVHRCDQLDTWVITGYEEGQELFRQAPVVRTPDSGDNS